MAKSANVISGLSRGIAETVGVSLTKQFQDFIEGGLKFNKGTLDKLSSDLLRTQGILDDSAGSIIFDRYRLKAGENKFQPLMRLLDCLTKAERDDLVIVSIGCLALTSKKSGTASENQPTAEPTPGVESNLRLLGIDFNDAGSFETLFQIYDHLVADFEKLEEEEGFAAQKRQKALALVKHSNLYGNETLKKRWCGLMVSIANWPEATSVLKQKGIRWLTKSLPEFLKSVDQKFSQEFQSAHQKSQQDLQSAVGKFQSQLHQKRGQKC